MAEKRRAPDDYVEDQTERPEPMTFKRVRFQLPRNEEGVPEKDVPATDTDDELMARLRVMRVKELVHDILAAMYYDFHQLYWLRKYLMQNHIRRFPDLHFYKTQHQEATWLLDRAIRQEMLAKVGQTSGHDWTYTSKQEAHRVGQFIRQLSWKILAICALSEAFRLALYTEDQVVWAVLMLKIRENRTSIDAFAQSRGLDWQGQLLKHADKQIPGLQQALIPRLDLAQEHFHHIIIANGSLRRPLYEGHNQINIDQGNIFNPSYFKDKKDPTIRVPDRDGPCDLCYAERECNCKISRPTLATCLVELVNYPHKGIGVRALARFKKGDILDEYVGELRPVDYKDDRVYALLHESKMVEGHPVALISAKRYGNWTRYLNHSCKPSTTFLKMTVGKKTIVAVQAVRDIDIFEEITIDYGKGYWKNRKCLCGEPGCRSQDATEEETEA
ncbi:histone-lysine N-methyltransferase, H3 lysine-9 specific SUVH1 [Aspergillus udagawae]|nr:histone-lysine N-methyltransferase, H3 lysine-9 specific SUVH1 [Aspergillus udagawae]GFF99936.1 histone-lysine N-methyltransferase, H3 lysine-9 specific SUVH1 [Aspergillus udagawae]GFG12896.1 histone-lysine N-methyltransferase, H3 lysine-9 specific SUVH1 [Aspergillus udagawae]GFG27729.1 histone-lysine N-methyltransferase, H3 lysine-9 specific SUVH1 [Aspergillus udagawae]